MYPMESCLKNQISVFHPELVVRKRRKLRQLYGVNDIMGDYAYSFHKSIHIATRMATEGTMNTWMNALLRRARALRSSAFIQVFIVPSVAILVAMCIDLWKL